MKTGVWIVSGLALTGVATLLSQSITAQNGIALGLSGYLPIMLIGTLGQYCFWRALRSAVGDVWSVTRGRKRKAETPPASPGSSGLSGSKDLPPLSDFDADAVFARYLAQRNDNMEQAQGEAPKGATTRDPSAHPQRGFGRKVV